MCPINCQSCGRPFAYVLARIFYRPTSNTSISHPICNPFNPDNLRICRSCNSGICLHNPNYALLNWSNIMQGNINSHSLNKYNPYHLVEKSPWPLFSSLGALSLVLSGLVYMNLHIGYLPLRVFLCVLLASYTWWRDIHRESSTQGNHTKLVINGLKTGIILFIISEVFFFVRFFWGFFHRRISPTPDLGQRWPPYGITPFNPIGVPLLNTILLLSSGVTVTWAHHEILKGIEFKSKTALLLTVGLGAVFTACQAFEYVEATFSIADSAFGSTFFHSNRISRPTCTNWIFIFDNFLRSI